jgi:hypothetical protein
MDSQCILILQVDRKIIMTRERSNLRGKNIDAQFARAEQLRCRPDAQQKAIAILDANDEVKSDF